MLASSIIFGLLSHAVPTISASDSQQPLVPFDHSQGYEFDPLLHLPGTSPYFDAVGYGLKHDAPEGCTVTAASYLIRHGAIYANDGEYEQFIKPFLERLDQHRGHWGGPLSFLNEWRSPIVEDKLEDLTPSGMHDARVVGQHIANRYSEIVNSTRRILADKKSRCYDTAQAFITRFPKNESIEIVKVHKPKDGSIDPTIPHKTCSAFEKTPGDSAFAEFVAHYAADVRARLQEFLPYKLEDTDVVAMQSICGYESGITAKRSPLCDVFTDDEWMAYEYAWDMKYAHMVGPLNKLSPYLGTPWLKAQAKIFASISDHESVPGQGWPDGQRLFLYFTHREVPPFVATVLGIFNSTFEMEEQFPTDHIVWTRAWKMSDLIPFLGHVGLEKMTCSRSGMEGEFVRVIANTAPRPMPRCQNGPGASCPFESFKDIIKESSQLFGDYMTACNNTKSEGAIYDTDGDDEL
jgi:hypothetical protein